MRTAKKRLSELSAGEEPASLRRELEQFESYEKAAAAEYEGVKYQLSKLLKEARQEMQFLAVRSDSTVGAMQVRVLTRTSPGGTQ